jgi:hypothetical protein
LPDGGWNFFYSTSRTATSRLGSGWSLDGAVFFGYAGSVQWFYMNIANIINQYKILAYF